MSIPSFIVLKIAWTVTRSQSNWKHLWGVVDWRLASWMCSQQTCSKCDAFTSIWTRIISSTLLNLSQRIKAVPKEKGGITWYQHVVPNTVSSQCSLLVKFLGQCIVKLFYHDRPWRNKTALPNHPYYTQIKESNHLKEKVSTVAHDPSLISTATVEVVSTHKEQ